MVFFVIVLKRMHVGVLRGEYFCDISPSLNIISQEEQRKASHLKKQLE